VADLLGLFRSRAVCGRGRLRCGVRAKAATVNSSWRHIYDLVEGLGGFKVDAHRNFDGEILRKCSGQSIVRWSRGMACQAGAVVDVRMGKVTWMAFTVTDCPDLEGNLITYRYDSRLLVTNGTLEMQGGRFREMECRAR
jgi:hypothetical protein